MAKNDNAPKSTGRVVQPEKGIFYNPPVPDVVRNYDFMGEYGRVGQMKYAGLFYEEYEPTLCGRRGVEVYKEMSESDSVVGAMFFAVEMLMRQADWHIESAGNNEKDKEAAEFVESCMNDMQEPWQDVISEIMSFLVFGWSYHEICYKRRMGKNKDSNLNSKFDDGLIGWKKLPIRSQDTLWQWVYDENDELLGMSQMAPPDFQIRTIPKEKALHFITKSKKQNPEGRSILRNCYRDWYFKKRVQEIEGIGIERDLAGLPMLTPPEGVDIWDKDDPNMVRTLAYAEQLVQNIRRDALEGIVVPNGWTFQLLNGGSRRQFEVGNIIERYDSRIAMTILADFVLLGHQQTGSWALSSDKTELFSVALGTYMNIICDVFNTQGIPRLIDLNGEHFKGITDYPRMVHGDIEKPDISKYADFVVKMVTSGVLMPTEDLQKEVCKVGGLPEPKVGEFAAINQPVINEAARHGTQEIPEPIKAPGNMEDGKVKPAAKKDAQEPSEDLEKAFMEAWGDK